MTTRANSNAAKIRRMLEKNPNLASATIADKLGVTSAYVSSVKWKLRQAAAPVAAPVAAPDMGSDSALDTQVGGDHYKKLAIQPVEYIHKNNIPFIEGCIIKYATRWKDKGGVKDLEKIKHFVDLLIELERRDGSNA